MCGGLHDDQAWTSVLPVSDFVSILSLSLPSSAHLPHFIISLRYAHFPHGNCNYRWCWWSRRFVATPSGWARFCSKWTLSSDRWSTPTLFGSWNGNGDRADHWMRDSQQLMAEWTKTWLKWFIADVCVYMTWHALDNDFQRMEILFIFDSLIDPYKHHAVIALESQLSSCWQSRFFY